MTAAPPARAEDWIGRTIDERYRIVAPLAEGGMGWVFVAEHLALQKEVALKVIRAAYAHKQEALVRFAREAVTTAHLEHAHVVAAYDFGELPEGGAYLVMQLVRGATLRDLLDDGHRFTWRAVADIGAQIADAMVAAHQKGVIHRDLKPGNVLVEFKDGAPFARVTDFGIARILESQSATGESQLSGADATGLTRVGVIIGTPGYMSPEQGTGDTVDARTDLYALGVVLWELLTGKLPFEGDSPAITLALQLSRRPQYPAGAPPCPKPLRELLLSLLAPDRGARPADAATVRDRLRELSGMGDAEEQLHDARETAERVASSYWTGLHAPETPGIRRAVLAGAPVLGVLLLAALAVVALRDPAPPPAPANPELNLTGRLEAAVKKLAPRPSTPPEVEARIADLFAQQARARRAAATWLLDYEPKDAVPEYARLLADLERARTCEKRRVAVEAIAELGDDRALPALERLSKSPRRGCGFLGLADCHDCLRKVLPSAIDALD